MSVERAKGVAKTGDPTGERDVFRSAGVPNIEGSMGDVYDYVQSKAEEVGREIRKNRGIPPKAIEGSMLTVEEKAVVILARACGVVWSEASAIINGQREVQGRALLPKSKPGFASRVLNDYGDVVEAIQADLLDSMEAWCPLASVQQRIVWRAKMIEYYHQEAIHTHQREDEYFESPQVPGRIGKQRAMKSLDNAMKPHLDFFDKLIVEDLSRYLKGPGGNLREQVAERKAERLQAVYEAFEAGEIDEVEKVTKLRELLHRDEGESETEATEESEG